MSHKKRNKGNKHHRHSTPPESKKVVKEMIHQAQFTPPSSAEGMSEEQKSESDSLLTRKLFKLIARGFYREKDILLHSTFFPSVGWLENTGILFILLCMTLFLWSTISGMDIFGHSKFVFIIDLTCTYLVVTRIAYHLRKYFTSKQA